MAELIQAVTGAVEQLAHRQIVGRSSACQIRLDDPRVSGEHAAILWDGHRWSLRDLSSRNGTWLDGQRLEPSEVAYLESGSRVGFGGPQPAWEVASIRPPGPTATWSDGLVEGDGDLLALPNEEDPEVLVYLREDSQWVWEGPDGTTPCGADETVEVRGIDYELQLPIPLPETLEARPLTCALSSVKLHFRVSSDEEHVELTVHTGRAVLPLGARAHHYLLLTLARARADDLGRDPNAPPSALGWVYREALTQMLRVETSSLNVAIHRARKELDAIGVRGAAGIVERRRSTGQVRLAAVRVQVESM